MTTLSEVLDKVALNKVLTEEERKMLRLLGNVFEASVTTLIAEGDVTNIFEDDDPECGCCPDDDVSGGPADLVPGGVALVGSVSTPAGDTGSCSGSDIDNVLGPFPMTWDVTDLAIGGTIESFSLYPQGIWIRPSTALAKTYIDFSDTVFSSTASAGHFAVYAIDADGTVLLTASISGLIATFSPAVATEVFGFMFVMDADSDTDYTWTRGSSFNVSDIDPTSATGSRVPNVANLVIGDYYELFFDGDAINSYELDTGAPGQTAGDESHSDFQYAMDGSTTGFSGHVGGYSTFVTGVPQATYVSDCCSFSTLPTGALSATVTWESGEGPPDPTGYIPWGRNSQTHIFFQATATSIRVKSMRQDVSVNVNCIAIVYHTTVTGTRDATLASQLFSPCGTTDPGDGGIADCLEWGSGTDPLLVHLRAFTPLRVIPTDPESMSVTVQQGIIGIDGPADKVIATQNVDLSSYIPATANYARWVEVSVMKDGTIVATAGTEVTPTTAILSGGSPVSRPTTPANTVRRLALVNIYRESDGTAQTVIHENAVANQTDIVDVRMWDVQPGQMQLGLDGLTTTRGSILYRGASGWTGLPPSTDGYVLTDGGTGADPAWEAATGGSSGGGETLEVNTTEVGNVGAGEDDLMTYSVPGATLSTDEQFLHFVASGQFATSINNKRLRVKFGATTLLDTGALAITTASDWFVEGWIIRTGATTQEAHVEFSSSSTVLLADAAYSTPGETLSGAVTFKLTGEATSNNDVVQKTLILDVNNGSIAVDAVVDGPDGFMINGKIAVTVSSNNITVALKTLADADPSAGDPVYARIGNVRRTITSALSVTKNAGTNWFASGAAELATQEIDYFAYLGYNATDGVVIGFSRIPYAERYGDFSATTTNEKYAAISTITTAASGDPYRVIGRFAATLSATASFNWSVPTYTNLNLIQRPIYETRWLTYAAVVTSGSGSITTLGSVTTVYQVLGRSIGFQHDVTITTNGTAAGGISVTLPFTTVQNREVDFLGRETAVAGFAIIAFTQSGTALLYLKITDLSHPGSNGARLTSNGFTRLI